MTDIRAALGAQRLEGEQRRHRHRWEWVEQTNPGDGNRIGWYCASCGVSKDVERSRRGRSSRNRGNRRELEIAKTLGGEKVGMYGGPEDIRTGLLNVQSKVRKAFPSWMTAEPGCTDARDLIARLPERKP